MVQYGLSGIGAAAATCGHAKDFPELKQIIDAIGDRPADLLVSDRFADADVHEV